MTPTRTARQRGFTLIELLVVIGIIALLIGILIPVVSHIKLAGYEANTKAEINALQTAIESYHNTFGTYPGPISNADLIGGSSGKAYCTGTENLTLALLGGAELIAGKYQFVQADVGQGPLSLNPAKVQRYPALIDGSTANLQPKPASGTWVAGGPDMVPALGMNAFTDTAVPEFRDRYPEPLPILYLRANNNATGITGVGPTFQYNPAELAPYNFPDPNKNRVAPKHNANTSDQYLAAAAAGTPSATVMAQYFTNQNTGTAYSNNGYILITAGPDRVFFSLDDQNSYGSPK